MKVMKLALIILLVTLTLPATAYAEADEGNHHPEEVTSFIWLAVSIILGAAAGDSGKKAFGLPRVIGQVAAGIAVFNFARLVLDNHFATAYQGMNGKEALATVTAYQGWMKVALIAIMFGAGLSEEPKHFRGQFIAGLPLAVLGALIPAASVIGLWYVFNFENMTGNVMLENALFAGIVLSATSISISAQVIADITGAKTTKEASRGFAAAVGDDVVGLALLSIVVSVVGTLMAGTELDPTALTVDVVWILVKAIGFVLIATYIGHITFGFVVRHTTWMEEHQTLLLFVWAFVGAEFAVLIRLEDVLGAFVFGLSAYSTYWKMTLDADDSNNIYEPIEITQSSTHVYYHILPLFSAGFFFSVGGQVTVELFTDPTNVIIAIIIAFVGALTKLAAAWLTSWGGINWLPVGMIMIARGEVGLIVVSIGIGFGVFSATASGILILAVLLTTIVGPIGTKWAFSSLRTNPLPNGNGH